MARRRFRRKRKRGGRRRFRRRTRRRIMRTKVLNGLNVLPDRVIVRLPYVEIFSITWGATNDYVYSMNSIFDPDVTSTGHQPLGHDQWALFYQNYRVISCRWSVVMVQETNVAGFFLAVVPSNTSAGMTSWATAAETPRSRIFHSALGTRTIHARGKVNCRAIAGLTRGQYMNNPDWSALMSAAPANQVYLHLVTTSAEGSSTEISVQVKLTFLCELFNRVNLTAS